MRLHSAVAASDEIETVGTRVRAAEDNLAIRWSIGLFSAAIGVLMLVTPHQFDTPAYAILEPHLWLWGSLFLASGALLVAVDFLAPARWLVVAAHALSAGMFLLLSWGFLPVGLLRGSVVYSILGLSLLVSLYQFRFAGPTSRGLIIDLPRVLAALAIGAGVATIFSVGLGSPAPADRLILLPDYSGIIGLAFVISGLAVLATETLSSMRPFTKAAPMLLAGTFLAWATVVSAPNRAWTGVLLYGGFGLLLAIWPWLRERMHLFRPTSLRTRFALALALMAAVPLIIATSFITTREESTATAAALEEQRVLASLLAHSVSDYLGRYSSAVETLSNFQGLLTLPPPAVEELLGDFHATYPEATSFSAFDAQGVAVARSDDRPAQPAGERLWFREVRDELRPTTSFAISPLLGRPIAVFAAPLLSAEGRFLGAVASAVETTQLLQLLTNATLSLGVNAFIVDDSGRTIANPDPESPDRLSDLSDLPPVAALARNEAGEIAYEKGSQTVLAAYARVPGSDLGLVVEQGRGSALAATRNAREWAFIFLLFTIAIAGLLGAIIANRLDDPLKRLADAATSLAGGNASSGLPESDVDEIANLSLSFRRMRDQLGERTAERERAMAALEGSEARLDAIFNQVIVGIAQIDLLGSFDLVNERFAELAARDPVELRGLRFEEIVHPDDRARLQHLLERLGIDGENFSTEICVCRPDDSSLWVEVGASVIRSEDGIVQHLLIAAQDISLQKAAQVEQEQLLAREREARSMANRANSRLRLLAEAGVALSSSLSHGGTLNELARLVVPRLADWCVIDLVDEEGNVTEVALAHTDPEKEAWGRELRRRYRPKASGPGSTRVMRTGKAQLIPTVSSADLRAAAQNDEHLALVRGLGVSSVIVVPIILGDRVIGALTVVRVAERQSFDDHDLELAQELARRSAIAIENARLFERAQELNRQLERRVDERTSQLRAAISELEAFNYTVSHDLRAPLRAIGGFGAALAEEFSESLGETGRGYLERVQTGTEHMNQLIEGLLELSRISMREIQRTTVDISRLARQTADLLIASGPDHGTEFLIQDGLEARADKALLAAVLDNLIGNAWKFTRGTPGPRIEFGVFEGESEKPTYFVRDNGVGFDPRHANRLFVPFQRLHSSSDFEGTGIGLATVQRIIQRHGGKIWAESEPGQGATFYFTLTG